MGEGLWWWLVYFLRHYWGWVLLYTAPLPIGMYIAYWRDRQGKSIDSSFEYVMCFAWPIVLAILCFVLIGQGINLLFRLFVRAVDHLILISIRHLVCSDETGELWRAPAPNTDLCIQWVKVQDKTGTYWIQVPPSIKTSREGVAWTYQMKPEEYSPSVRT